jgi:hypothetical protein
MSFPSMRMMAAASVPLTVVVIDSCETTCHEGRRGTVEHLIRFGLGLVPGLVRVRPNTYNTMGRCNDSTHQHLSNICNVYVTLIYYTILYHTITGINGGG